MNMSKLEKKDVGKSKSLRKTSTVEEKLSNAGNEKEQTRRQQIFTTNVENSLGGIGTSKSIDKKRIGAEKHGELKSCDTGSLSRESSKLCEGKTEDTKDETLKSHDDYLRTGQKPRLAEGTDWQN